jgi:heterodisulfide reductase subunit B
VTDYAFFRGCYIPVRAPHIEYVARKILPELDVNLVDIDEFTCCPEPTGYSIYEKKTWLAMAARNICLAQEKGLDIITLCNGCYYTLHHTVEELENLELRAEVNEILAPLGYEYKGTSKVYHFVQVLTDEVGAETIKEHIKHPLTRLKVAVHTGCHFSNIFGKDTKILDDLVTLLGAESIDYENKNLCCGWSMGIYGDRDEGDKWLGERLIGMHKAGADVIAVICPQCYNTYDMVQMMAARKIGLDFKIPVLFYLQLLGLAMGYSLDEMQYSSHRVKTDELANKIG